ncbi:hypothetical protein Goari_022830 [Gossypium aridum]|uniref:Uncharacterized protein n=1 Tax=Gossypium aridum TaxID=34290 RepID=A0A7J8YTM2_GOSAI|nr:hypothetical protein [Gossypium aridum]
MAKVSFVAFSLTLVLSSQFIVGQNEKAIDEAAFPEAVGVFGALVMTGIISKLQDDGMQGEHLKKIIADPNFVSREGLVDLGDVTSDPNFKEEVAKAIRYFRSIAKDNANTENEKN